MASRQFRITLHNGKTLDVQPTLEDRLKFETTLRKNKSWGPLADNALKLEPFLAWSAASRLGHPVGTWDEFTTGTKAALDVESIKDEPTELEVEGLGEGTPTADSNISPSSSD